MVDLDQPRHHLMISLIRVFAVHKSNFICFKFQKKERNEFADDYMNVGFRLYLILARMVDIDPKVMDTSKLKRSNNQNRI